MRVVVRGPAVGDDPGRRARADGAPLLHEHADEQRRPSFDEACRAAATPTSRTRRAGLGRRRRGDARPLIWSSRPRRTIRCSTRTRWSRTTRWRRTRTRGSRSGRPRSTRSWSARTWPACFTLPLSKVRIVTPFVGGGYGSKSYTKIEPLAAVGSWFAGRPVKLALDVEEAMLTTRADAAVVTMRTGFDRDGHILARDVDVELNGGAYADNSPLVLAKSANRSFGPYRVPALEPAAVPSTRTPSRRPRTGASARRRGPWRARSTSTRRRSNSASIRSSCAPATSSGGARS